MLRSLFPTGGSSVRLWSGGAGPRAGWPGVSLGRHWAMQHLCRLCPVPATEPLPAAVHSCEVYQPEAALPSFPDARTGFAAGLFFSFSLEGIFCLGHPSEMPLAPPLTAQTRQRKGQASYGPGSQPTPRGLLTSGAGHSQTPPSSLRPRPRDPRALPHLGREPHKVFRVLQPFCSHLTCQSPFFFSFFHLKYLLSSSLAILT